MFGLSKNDRRYRAECIRRFRAGYGRRAAYRKFGRLHRS